MIVYLLKPVKKIVVSGPLFLRILLTHRLIPSLLPNSLFSVQFSADFTPQTFSFFQLFGLIVWWSGGDVVLLLLLCQKVLKLSDFVFVIFFDINVLVEVITLLDS